LKIMSRKECKSSRRGAPLPADHNIGRSIRSIPSMNRSFFTRTIDSG
jgi:hypothetical protein